MIEATHRKAIRSIRSVGLHALFIVTVLTSFPVHALLKADEIPLQAPNDAVLRFEMQFGDRQGMIQAIRLQPLNIVFDARQRATLHLPEAEVDAKLTRLESYFEAQLSWASQMMTITEEQKIQARRAFENRLCELQEEANKLETTFDDSPLRFETHGLAKYIFGPSAIAQMITDQLTSEQNQTLKAAVDERQTWLATAVCDHAYEELNQEMHFLPEQEANLKSHFLDRLPTLQTPFVSLLANRDYLPYANTINLLVRLSNDDLTVPQRRIWTELNNRSKRPRNVQQFVVNEIVQEDKVNDHLEARRKQLKTLEEQYQTVAAKRVEDLSHLLELSPSEKRRLELAYRGAVRYLMQPEHDALNTVQPEEVQGQLIRFAGQGAEKLVTLRLQRHAFYPQKLDKHPLVLEALRQILSKNQSADELAKNGLEDATVHYAVSLLDRELWLTEPQRKFIAEKLTGNIAVRQALVSQSLEEADVRDFRLLYLAIVALDDRSRAIGLTSSQRAVSQQLRDRFLVDGERIKVKVPPHRVASFRNPRY